MNVKEGQIWICTEPSCQAVIEVRRSAKSTCHGKFTLRCCCGKDLVLEESIEHAGPHTVEQDNRPSTRT